MWLPHVTVAVIVEKDGKFLMVEEIDNSRRVLNQPAGHVEEGENITDAALRETLEETCWEVELCSALGIARFVAPNGHTYFRHSFVAKAITERRDLSRDSDIEAVHWMTFDDIMNKNSQLRSPMVMNDLLRYTSGATYPLTIYADIAQ